MQQVIFKENVVTIAGLPDLKYLYVIHPDTKQCWIFGTQIAAYMGYKNAKRSVATFVDSTERMYFSNLFDKDSYEFVNTPKHWHSKTVMITEKGFFQLISRSHMKGLDALRDLITPKHCIANLNKDTTEIHQLQLLLNHNLPIFEDTVKKLEIAKTRIVPDIAKKNTVKVNYLSLYVLDRNIKHAISEEKRPIHVICRTQKQRLENLEDLIKSSRNESNYSDSDNSDNLTDSANESSDDEEDDESDKDSANFSNFQHLKRRRSYGTDEWAKYATQYYKKLCPNAISNWLHVKISNNPLWYGINFIQNKRYQLHFLSKPALVRKFEQDSQDSKIFEQLQQMGIMNVDILYEKCYTELENEKDVLIKLIVDDLEAVQREFAPIGQIRTSFAELTADEISY